MSAPSARWKRVRCALRPTAAAWAAASRTCRRWSRRWRPPYTHDATREEPTGQSAQLMKDMTAHVTLIIAGSTASFKTGLQFIFRAVSSAECLGQVDGARLRAGTCSQSATRCARMASPKPSASVHTSAGTRRSAWRFTPGAHPQHKGVLHASLADDGTSRACGVQASL